MQRYSLVFMVLIFLCTTVSAAIYRSVDEHGNVVFSDRAQATAEKVELPTYHRYRVQLKRVIDGDTLELETGEKVRLIGINTPEVDSRFSQAQPGGQKAKDWLKERVQSSVLFIEYDHQRYDKYDRLLAHCFLQNGDYINARLLQTGHAMLTLTPPNLRYADSLIAAQRQAEQQSLGVWTLPSYQAKNVHSFSPGQSYHGWQRWQLTARASSRGQRYSKLIVSKHLVIQIPNENLALFDSLESYTGKPLEVRGWISRRGDQHTIKINHPSAIIRL